MQRERPRCPSLTAASHRSLDWHDRGYGHLPLTSQSGQQKGQETSKSLHISAINQSLEKPLVKPVSSMIESCGFVSVLFIVVTSLAQSITPCCFSLKAGWCCVFKDAHTAEISSTKQPDFEDRFLLLFVLQDKDALRHGAAGDGFSFVVRQKNRNKSCFVTL